MNQLSAAPAWHTVKAKLMERFGHVSLADLARVEQDETAWLPQMQRLTDQSPLEIARFVDETTNDCPTLDSMMSMLARNEELQGYWRLQITKR